MDGFGFHLIRSLSTTSSLELIAQFDDGTVKKYDVSCLFDKHEVFKTFMTFFQRPRWIPADSVLSGMKT